MAGGEGGNPQIEHRIEQAGAAFNQRYVAVWAFALPGKPAKPAIASVATPVRSLLVKVTFVFLILSPRVAALSDCEALLVACGIVNTCGEGEGFMFSSMTFWRRI